MGSLFVTVLFIVALITRNVSLQKVSLWFLVGIALLTVPAYLRGDPAQEAVRGLPDISNAIIHTHETMARFGLILMFVTGLIALASAILTYKRPKLSPVLLSLVLVALLLNSGFFAYVGFLGGQIHHEEIRTPSTTATLKH
jgi:hypothetical protein